MKSSKLLINFCIIPFLCVLPLFGSLACTVETAADNTATTLESIGDQIGDLPNNLRLAAPDIQKDFESVWYGITNEARVISDDYGITEPPHSLARAQEAREKLIAGATFADVLAGAMTNLTTEDLENIPTSDLNALNGILPFEVNLESCGENLAEVLNSLDIGQVSAILQSDTGYHLIQLLDRDGARVRIGHVVFEIDPVNDAVDNQPDGQLAEDSAPLDQAIDKLASVLEERW